MIFIMCRFLDCTLFFQNDPGGFFFFEREFVGSWCLSVRSGALSLIMVMICNQIRNSLLVVVRSLGMCAQHASQSVSQPARLNVLCGRSRMSFLGFTMNFFLPSRRRAAPLSCCFDFGLTSSSLLCWRVATMNDVFFGRPRRRWALFLPPRVDGCSTPPTTTTVDVVELTIYRGEECN